MQYLFQGESLENKGYYDYSALFEDGAYNARGVKIFRIGEVFLSGNEVCDVQTQDHHELVFTLIGSMFHVLNGIDLTVTRHDALLIPKGFRHQIKAMKNTVCRFFYVEYEVDEDAGADLAESALALKDQYMLVNHAGDMGPFVKSIFDELTNLHANSNEMIGCHMKIISLLLQRQQLEAHTLKGSPRVSERQNMIQEVKLYLNNNFMNIKSLNQIGNALGYSYTYLTHIFSETTGVSIKSYYNDLRFRYAAEMLLLGELTNDSIARTLHYKSEQAFSKAFKAYYGISPQLYCRISRPR